MKKNLGLFSRLQDSVSLEEVSGLTLVHLSFLSEYLKFFNGFSVSCVLLLFNI